MLEVQTQPKMRTHLCSIRNFCRVALTSPSARAGGTMPPIGSSSSELNAKAAAALPAGRSAGPMDCRLSFMISVR